MPKLLEVMVENVTEPGEIDAALARGLAATRSGRPAVVAFWLEKLIASD